MSAQPEFPSGSRPAAELTVPASWKGATLGAPVPVVRCTYIFPDTHERPGEQCRRWSIRGALKCVKHGGNLPNVQEHAQAVVEAARLRLFDLGDGAIDTIDDMMRNATSEAVRLKAATEVLDRIGVKTGETLDVNVSVAANPADAVKDRLAQLRKRNEEARIAEEAVQEMHDSVVVEGEVVDPPAEDVTVEPADPDPASPEEST